MTETAAVLPDCLPAGRPTQPTAGRAALALAPAAAPALRLLAVPASEPPFDDEVVSRPTLRLVPAPVHRLVRALPAPVDGLTGKGDLPDARPFAQALVQRLLEVCGGVRPVPQLQRDTTPGLYAELERALLHRPRTAGPRPGARDVRSVHVQQPTFGVAEVCATVRRGDRWGAIALRLEAVHGRWRCTRMTGV